MLELMGKKIFTIVFSKFCLSKPVLSEGLKCILLFEGNKEEMKKKREEAFKKVEERLKEESTKKDENKRANEKLALKEIMKVSTCISPLRV